MNKTKSFDCVAWVRAIRDENYKKYGHLPASDYLDVIQRKALQSDILRRYTNQKIKIG